MNNKKTKAFLEYPLPPLQKEAAPCRLVTPGKDKLIYSPYNEEGDHIPDYSYAGYCSGKKPLPLTKDVPLAERVFPSDFDDDTPYLQEVIDRVSKLVPPGEMRTIQLEAGIYQIHAPGLKMKSGVLLSGAGQSPVGTVLYGADPEKYSVISICGSSAKQIGEIANIIDDYVPAGSVEIHLSQEDIKRFQVGDLITLYHPATKEWISQMEMDDMKDLYGNPSSWLPGDVDMPTQRTIEKIEGTKITLDFPLYVPFIGKYAKSYIYRTDDSEKVQWFGIENLRLESCYNKDEEDEQHPEHGIEIKHAKNGFVRDVSAKYFIASAVRCASGSKEITVQHCSSLQPVSRIVGGRRYSFSCGFDVQQILFTGCYSYGGRHDYTASYEGTGPLAFVDSVADRSNQSSEPHGLWTTGLLFDNIYHTQPGGLGFMAFPNTGVLGIPTTHGWCTAGSVAWNCLTGTLLAHKPPLSYQNFLIGVFGCFADDATLSAKQKNIYDHMNGGYRTSKVPKGDEKTTFSTSKDTPFVGDSYQESKSNPVEPRSLFKAQLAERLTGNFNKAKPNAPILLYPRSDMELLAEEVVISGIYQKGAQQVTIYIDDKPHYAELCEDTGLFHLTVEPGAGWHKIYATQTILGVESTKNADRFILLGEGKNQENYEYLQSHYSGDKTSLFQNS